MGDGGGAGGAGGTQDGDEGGDPHRVKRCSRWDGGLRPPSSFCQHPEDSGNAHTNGTFAMSIRRNKNKKKPSFESEMEKI